MKATEFQGPISVWLLTQQQGKKGSGKSGVEGLSLFILLFCPSGYVLWKNESQDAQVWFGISPKVFICGRRSS